MVNVSSRVFFLIGCGRSGTTSLSRILGTATNAVCLVEPSPNLNRECRDMIEGRLSNPRIVVELIRSRIDQTHAKGLIHGEKQLTLAPFIPTLHNAFECKFVLIHRDGREVVRSWLEWHNQMFGSVYRECTDPGPLTERAFKASAALPLDYDHADYSRPRPRSSDAFHGEWENLSRMEMCAWYWSFMNGLALDNLALIPRKDWMSIDYTTPDVDDILSIAKFLGLEGVHRSRVEEMLAARINSIRDRIGEIGKLPCWQDWPREEKERFARIAEPIMARLGYPRDFTSRSKPAWKLDTEAAVAVRALEDQDSGSLGSGGGQ